MTNPVPPLHPNLQRQVDHFAASTAELLDRYTHSFEMDANRHAVKHGRMARERMVYDMTRILARDVPANMLAGIAAEAIVRSIERKRQGKG